MQPHRGNEHMRTTMTNWQFFVSNFIELLSSRFFAYCTFFISCTCTTSTQDMHAILWTYKVGHHIPALRSFQIFVKNHSVQFVIPPWNLSPIIYDTLGLFSYKHKNHTRRLYKSKIFSCLIVWGSKIKPIQLSIPCLASEHVPVYKVSKLYNSKTNS